MSRIFGRRAIEDLMRTDPGAVAGLVVPLGDLGDAERRLVEHARDLGIEIREAPADERRRRSGARGGARLGADVRVAGDVDLDTLHAEPGEPSLVLALDGITDPHNLGAIMRTAAVYGARAVVVAKDRAAPLNDAAVRASAGGVAHVPLVRVVNLARALRTLADRGYWVMGTRLEEGQPLWEADLTGPIVLVLGAEGRGLRPGVAKACDLAIHLPTPGPVQSLNVSVFAGVACAEVARQRREVAAKSTQ
ncbi:MAG: 23S rRNA (guanosine(2251)-2'-O)-methyltransferase RlmB [Myxococcota bacterium]